MMLLVTEGELKLRTTPVTLMFKRRTSKITPFSSSVLFYFIYLFIFFGKDLWRTVLIHPLFVILNLSVVHGM